MKSAKPTKAKLGAQYQSQYHFEDDFQKDKERKLDSGFVVSGTEMHVLSASAL
jgi:hypothetical protein